MNAETPQPSDPAGAAFERRARVVCAATFGAAAALSSALVIGLVVWVTGEATLDGRALLAPLSWAAPSALVGALAGRRLAAMPTAGGGGFVGAGVTVASAVVLLLGLYLVQAAAAPAQSGTILAELLVPAVWWITLGVATLLSPVGALAGWLAWRRLHRRTPAS